MDRVAAARNGTRARVLVGRRAGGPGPGMFGSAPYSQPGSKNERVAEPSAPAQRRHPGAAAAVAELERERERKWEPAPGHTDRVTKGDRAPPLGLSISTGTPSSWAEATTTAAKDPFTSMTSRSESFRPQRPKASTMAWAG